MIYHLLLMKKLHTNATIESITTFNNIYRRILFISLVIIIKRSKS